METVHFQIFMFSITLYGGLLIGVIYDIYKVVKRMGHKKGPLTFLWDILFLFTIFFVAFYIIFSGNFGDLRAYVFLGFIVGFFLYEKIIGRIFEAIFFQLFSILKSAVKTSEGYIIFIFKCLYSFIRKLLATFIHIVLGKLEIDKKISKIRRKALKEYEKYYRLLVKRGKS